MSKTWSVRRKVALAWLVPICLAVSTAPTLAVECGMSLAFRQPDSDAQGGRTEVWADEQGSALLFIEKLHVNTDGTRRSYRVDDFWGQRVALNNLCNAMTDACEGLNASGLKARRLLTQQAAASGWPKDLLAKTRISPSIIPMRGGKPCTTADGYLVSATALRSGPATDACDLRQYLDSLAVPALVLPRNSSSASPSGFAVRNARIGDLVVALRRDEPKPVFAVVGDAGPASKLGEGSIALNGALLGKTSPPENYLEVRGKAPFVGKGWSVPPTVVLVFPGSRNVSAPMVSRDRIDAAASPLFANWGGIERIQACINAYPKSSN